MTRQTILSKIYLQIIELRPLLSLMISVAALAFGTYLTSCQRFTAPALASETCKHVYSALSMAREILQRNGKLNGLVTKSPYVQLIGALYGEAYYLRFKTELFGGMAVK